jgi:hypothetical protein
VYGKSKAGYRTHTDTFEERKIMIGIYKKGLPCNTI